MKYLDLASGRTNLLLLHNIIHKTNVAGYTCKIMHL